MTRKAGGPNQDTESNARKKVKFDRRKRGPKNRRENHHQCCFSFSYNWGSIFHKVRRGINALDGGGGGIPPNTEGGRRGDRTSGLDLSASICVRGPRRKKSHES